MRHWRGVGRVLALLLALGAADRGWADETIRQIHFARGASSADLPGTVVRGDRDLYSVSANAGQRMSVRLTSVENNAVLQLYAPGARPVMRDGAREIAGKTLPGAGEGEDATQWAGALPQSGSYLFVVGGTRGNATYRLSVSIR